MKITVKLFATLREGREKIQTFDLSSCTTPKDFLNLLGISIQEVAILLINGRDGEFDRILSENDTLSIFPPVGGG
jgi:sulfur-carrier protein